MMNCSGTCRIYSAHETLGTLRVIENGYLGLKEETWTQELFGLWPICLSG